jgi:hypothetical protein
MISTARGMRLRRCTGAEIGLGDQRDRGDWSAADVLLAASGAGSSNRSRTAASSKDPVDRPAAVEYLLALPATALGGPALTAFLDRVAPFGCPVPGSLIRAYSLPDAPFPSILLKEHETGHEGISDGYLRFLALARRRWIDALQETGPGLCPAVAWRGGPDRAFGDPGEWAATISEAGAELAGAADDYLGRGLLLLTDPGIASAWPPMMSLGGVTKIRKITGREFPVWVDLPAHQPDLLASPVLARVEHLFAES